MLIQSHTGTIRIFPAIPDSWKEVSFRKLRTEGAFLVSADRERGSTVKVKIEADNSGILSLADPFDGRLYTICGKTEHIIPDKQGIIQMDLDAGQVVTLEAPGKKTISQPAGQ